MEFEDRLAALTAKVSNQASAIGTEEATKNAFVMPFISTILGSCSTFSTSMRR